MVIRTSVRKVFLFIDFITEFHLVCSHKYCIYCVVVSVYLHVTKPFASDISHEFQLLS